MLRTLISEGRLVYPVVVTRDNAAPVTEIVEREGPTGVIVASSAVRVDRDLETRLIRLHVPDDPDLTRAIAERIGVAFELGGIAEADRSAWHALYRWHRLAGPYRVRVPFAPRVSRAIPPAAVRLRRDVSVLWTLVAAHAALHRLTRETDREGRSLRSRATTRPCASSSSPCSRRAPAPAFRPGPPQTWEALAGRGGRDTPGITYTRARRAARHRPRRAPVIAPHGSSLAAAP